MSTTTDILYIKHTKQSHKHLLKEKNNKSLYKLTEPEKRNVNKMAAKKLTADDLPMMFQAKYLGSCKAPGAWGLKNTRTPVDVLVENARSNRQNLPQVEIKVTTEGIEIHQLSSKRASASTITFTTAQITYGVQDVNFTRVFCMIINNPNVSAKDAADQYILHGFACPSKLVARQITFALGAAFTYLADLVKSKQEETKLKQVIDLRVHEGRASDDDEAEA